jgi:hypothetical protein
MGSLTGGGAMSLGGLIAREEEINFSLTLKVASLEGLIASTSRSSERYAYTPLLDLAHRQKRMSEAQLALERQMQEAARCDADLIETKSVSVSVPDNKAEHLDCSRR